MNIATIILIVSFSVLVIANRLIARAEMSDELGDFLDRHSIWIAVLFFSSAAFVAGSLGAIAALALSN